jgi:hypothetical protein
MLLFYFILLFFRLGVCGENFFTNSIFDWNKKKWENFYQDFYRFVFSLTPHKFPIIIIKGAQSNFSSYDPPVLQSRPIILCTKYIQLTDERIGWKISIAFCKKYRAQKRNALVKDHNWNWLNESSSVIECFSLCYNWQTRKKELI